MPCASAEYDLFNAARRLAAPAERAVFLRSECGPDERLRARVEALLAAYEATDNPLDGVPAGLGAAAIERTVVPDPFEAPAGVRRPALAASPRRARVVLVPEPGRSASPDDVSALLRKRLRVIVLIISAFYTLQLLRSVFIHFQWIAGFPTQSFALGFYGLILATAGGFAGILWRGRPLSIRSLRAIELVTFLQITVLAAWITRADLQSEWVRRYATAEGLGPLLVTRAHALNWFALIVVYGALIPNTWRRCAAVAGAMALTPLVVGTAAGLSDDGLRTHVLPGYLADVMTWVAVAVALAVYGSHRIEVLRREVSTARTLGQYVLKEQLGAGGMGEVYLAEHAMLRRPCAIKVIRPERAGDPENLRRFEREVQATAALTHPNTVQVFDYGHADDGTFFYVMEFLPGETLDELVAREGPLPPDRAVRLLRQVCGALAEAHGRGLTHRDVKPGNVMVCDRGGDADVAKLLDFGLVLPPLADLSDPEDGETDRRFGATEPAAGGDAKLTRAGMITGTPGYLSPEQARGQGEADARSDIYSLGALAYFLLAGRPPFAGRSPVETLAAHLYEIPRPLRESRPGVPAGLEAVVLRCLAKDPAGRYPDARSLDAALADALTSDNAGRAPENDGRAIATRLGGPSPGGEEFGRVSGDPNSHSTS